MFERSHGGVYGRVGRKETEEHSVINKLSQKIKEVVLKAGRKWDQNF